MTRAEIAHQAALADAITGAATSRSDEKISASARARSLSYGTLRARVVDGAGIVGHAGRGDVVEGPVFVSTAEGQAECGDREGRGGGHGLNISRLHEKLYGVQTPWQTPSHSSSS